jgi:lipopolysaccharide transport system permease protein
VTEALANLDSPHSALTESAAGPSTPGGADDLPVSYIRPPSGWISLNLGEVWRYRDLLVLLVWRDISASYRQSVIGFGWAIIKPVFSMLIFTLVFGGIAKLPSDGVPYPIFSYAALLPWMYFSGCLAGASGSVLGGAGLLTKVYFPRLVLPLSSVVKGLVDFAIQFVVLVLMMAYYGIAPSAAIVLLPAFILLCAVSALSIGLWLTALNVKYRDVGQLVPFLSQAWMWLTPVVYPSSLVPEKWRMIYGLNPLVGIVEGFRWSLLGNAPPDWTMLGVSLAVTALLFVSGLYYFRKMETTFADVI